MKNKVIIIGGVAGGATAGARLRRLSEQSEIIIFEKGEYISFANCGLPYYIGGEITNKASLTLQTPASFNSRYNIDVRNNTEVTGIDRKAKQVIALNKMTNQTYTESYDKLIISVGAVPVKPALNGIEKTNVFTLRNLNDTYRIKEYISSNCPKTAAVVGGGYIGVEMAENLTRAGVAVTIYELNDYIIPPLDFDMAIGVESYIKSKGVSIKTKTEVKSYENLADMVVVAVGITPDTAIAKDAGLSLNERGYIKVDNTMLSSDSDIYAVGDAIEVNEFVTNTLATIPLAGPANKQGRIAADNITGKKSVYDGTQASSILRIFDMTIATTGISEKTAKRLNLDYDKVFTYSASHATYYPNATFMTIKTIFEKTTGKILGAQVIGFDGVDKRCDVLATAIRLGATAADLTKLELCYAPPYSSAKDPVNMVGYVIENVLNGTVKNFHWHDVKKLPSDGSVTLLDTRTAGEFVHGAINGFINIPLDELRNRLNEIDKSKPVYLTCQIGMRGYLAARILSQNGFDVYNLNGGYRLYSQIEKGL